MQIDRDSTEYVVVTLTTQPADATITSRTVSVTPDGERPTVWTPLTLLGADWAVLVGPGSGWPLLPGLHQVWVRLTSGQETPEIRCAEPLLVG